MFLFAFKDGLSRRPIHPASGQQMYMQMPHGLAAFLAVIDDQAEIIRGAQIVGYAFSRQQQMAEQFPVLVGRIGQPPDIFFRDDQYVMGGLRRDVFERQAQFVFINDVGRNFSGDNFIEESVGHRAVGNRYRFGLTDYNLSGGQ